MGAFGEKFRTERERRGFTLDDVSNVTKINSRMLKAIEDEHFDQLPGGVFNKGFVRAYAKHLGFNDEESVTEYLAALRQAQVQAQTADWQPDVPPQFRAEPGRPARVRTAQPSPEQARAEQVHEKKVHEEKASEELLATQPVRVEPKSRLASKIGVAKTVPDETKREVKREPKPEIKNLPQAQMGESSSASSAPVSPQKYPSADLDLGRIVPPTDSIPWKVPAVVLVVILVAAVWWNRHSRGVQAEVAPTPHHPESRITAANNSPPATAVPAAAAHDAAIPASAGLNPGSASTAQSVANGKLATAAAAGERDAAPTHAATNRATEDRAAPDHTILDRTIPDGTIPDRTIPDRTIEDHPASDRALAVRKLPGATSTAKAPPAFTLRIRASETSWISVIADGQPAVQETLIAPASTTIRATREITVKVGNAAGVSFLLNGKEIQPQGSQAEVKTFTFDSKEMKEAARTPAPEPAH